MNMNRLCLNSTLFTLITLGIATAYAAPATRNFPIGNGSTIRVGQDATCDMQGSIHCTAVKYQGSKTVSVVIQDSAGTNWTGSTCENLQPIDQKTTIPNIKTGDILDLLRAGFAYPSTPKFVCGVTTVSTDGGTVTDNYQLITNAEGAYINSNPRESDLDLQ